jgi:hypothetical protein
MGLRVLIISRVQLEIYLELISRGHYSHNQVLNFVVFIYCVPCLGQHSPMEARRALGSCWALLLLTWPSKTRSDSISC